MFTRQVQSYVRRQAVPSVGSKFPRTVLSRFLSSKKMFEETVCKVDELPEKSLKEFKLKEGSILLGKENGHVYAVGTKCSHYGAPLEKGVIHNGSVSCPWHAACFSMKTGDIEEFPGIDGIPCYKAEVVNGVVKVSGDLEELKGNKRKEILTKESSEESVIVIVGGGVAGFECAHTLRSNKFNGRIILITADDALPYDRTKLSKVPNSTVESILLKPADYYKETEINTIISSKVTKIDPKSKTVHYGDKSVIYTKLFLATGTKPREFKTTGSDLKNIYYLRTPKEGNGIASSAPGKHVVVLGTSFIGMEIAAYLVGKAASVTVVGQGNVPFEAAFGARIGQRLQQLHESKGVKFQMQRKIKAFEGNESGQVKSIKLDNGEVLPADICIIGIGVQPDTAYLKKTGIEMSRDYIVVNTKMETNVKDIYAGGDVAFFPLKTEGGKSVAIGHWQMAQSHGQTAAMNILGQSTDVEAVPFFWSMLFGKGLRYCGHATDASDLHIVGNLEELDFVAYFFGGGKVTAIMSMTSAPIAVLFAAVTKSGVTLSKDEILKNPNAWIEKYQPTMKP